MACPPSYRELAPPLPSIKIHAGEHYDIPFGRTGAMPIPGIEPRHYVPPALPPPPEPFAEHRRAEDIKRERRGYASNYGSISSSCSDQRPSLKRRDTGSTTGDEGYASYASTNRSREAFPTEFVALQHNNFSFKSAAECHGDSMKAKLDCLRPLDRSPSRSMLSDAAHREARLPPPANHTLQLAIHSRERGLSDSRESSFSNYRHYDRSPQDGSEIDYSSPRTRSRRNTGDETNAIHGSYDYHATEDMEMEETSSLKRLYIDEPHLGAGQKRRAPSPPDEYAAHGPVGVAEAMRRREGGVRSSSAGRLATIPQGSSLASAASSRANSYLSTLSIPPSQSSIGGFGHRSPSGISPNGVSPSNSHSPYTTAISPNPSPRGSISRGSVHSRAPSSASSPRKVGEPGKAAVTKLQGFYMCECCPKKPKKFDSAEELAAHEAEKQYECNYCGNRFKNKNEAERHQNSLHVRRHSWSCSALSGYDRAFHESTNRPGEADVCGYCGEEFARTGVTPGTGALSGGVLPKRPTDNDWDERIRHLQEVHKFRECNSSKKFYRADHFRQHLKHSHAGTSGKWTNMLENACLMDEDPAQPGGRN
ncbi:Zinc finger, C2H2-type/integrase, DNA-binding protein [Cordyceps fumosorosea ARSEF 2679]|uniref:Zinc finger, C2H2-type/integrase, DNA-binding protein n=1 Tax=Cordyceps fumosorosea (strain ARSEF 2679) TaxID=1081104 RepID=A0A167VY01_CORFA|nr:Zinc finger, C2H2-type/integrase, DNA-binding protein [Cordyceps fumosorosea ARSEF 2679]OAA63106.1 Zinc finger, C2H2-type/integrase, DNA-binding protein [Cordyceps fumosorosea ARSEF 2679]